MNRLQKRRVDRKMREYRARQWHVSYHLLVLRERHGCLREQADVARVCLECEVKRVRGLYV